uniref:Uncharacterized protein n=1 Tax=Panagrolaimus sp. ES5 TaxID=591445 RepID=A0AC34GSB9_9BILA
MDTTVDDHTERRRKEMAEIRKMKAKKAHRKPLPAKVHQKRKEKKKQRKVSAAKKKKKDILIKDDEGRVFLRRRPIPDDPAYEGIVRNLLEEMPPDIEQDILDGVYVHAVACELNWMEADEEQMMPRIETLKKDEYSKLKKEKSAEFAQILKAYDKWVSAFERFKSPEIADILVAKKNDDKPLPVPWIGVEEPKSNSDERKRHDKRKKKKNQSKQKVKKSQTVEDLEEKSGDENQSDKT